jgi:hypothetical protein
MGKGLGVAALIFGLIGAGLGGYVFVANTFFPSTGESPSIQDTWFIYDVGPCKLGDFVYNYFDPISLVISVNPNESVYILFTCYVRLDTTATDAYISIYIDGVNQIYFLITRTSTGTERIPVSIQYGKSTLSSGAHNVSIWGYSNIANQECYRCSLLVQTYK